MCNIEKYILVTVLLGSIDIMVWHHTLIEKSTVIIVKVPPLTVIFGNIL